MVKKVIKRIKGHKIGLRTLKTAFAVVITLLICDVINVSNPFFAAIAAIIAMESTLAATYETARDRILGTVLGAFIAFILSMLIPINPVTLGAGIVVVIYTCNVFKWNGTIKIATIVFMAVLLGYDEGSRFEYAFFRVVDTTIGLVVGTLVNYYIFPVKISDHLVKTLEDILQHVDDMLSRVLSHHDVNTQDLNQLKHELSVFESQFKLLKKEMTLDVREDIATEPLRNILQCFDKMYSHFTIIEELNERDLPNKQVVRAYHEAQLNQLIIQLDTLKKASRA